MNSSPSVVTSTVVTAITAITAITVPDRYNCAITGDVMTMPVIVCNNGHTFDMAAITEWRHSQRPNCHLCPTCRKPLLDTVIRNLDLQESIEGFQARVKAGYTGPGASIAPSTTASVVSASVVSSASSTSVVSSNSSASSASSTKISAKAVRLLSNKVNVVLRPETGISSPLYFTLIFDSSGSMSATETLKTADGDFNISMIWLAKHCARCIARLPGETAYLSIIDFNESATKILPYTLLTEAGIDEVDLRLKPLKAGGTTNLFQALKKVEAAPVGSCQVTILLTDGQPDPIPGYYNFLDGIRTASKGWPVFASTLHTIAFGNNLDSKVLQGLAAMSPGGRFFHSPSRNEIAPVILGLVATEMVRVSDGIDLIANFKNGTSARVKTGPLYLGQDRILTLESIESVVIEGASVSIGFEEDSPLVLRDELITLLSQSLSAYDQLGVKPSTFPSAEGALNAFHYRQMSNAYAKDFRLDIHSTNPSQGQLVLATKYMNTWGVPYLRAYLDGLVHCMPFNMMDPGLLGFMGPPIAEIRKTLQLKMLDVKLWPLVEEPSSYGGYGSHSLPSAAATRTAISTYLSGEGSCFAPGTPISIPGNLTKRIQDLKPGDQVMTPIGPATVRFLLEASTYEKTQSFCQVTPGLLITKYHPIRNPITGEWEFPANMYPVLELPILTVLNLILDRGHVVIVDGIECCTMAHGFKGPVIEHEFFGTNRVIEAMSRQPGFNEGLPVYKNLRAVRDSATHMIVDWIDQA